MKIFLIGFSCALSVSFHCKAQSSATEIGDKGNYKRGYIVTVKNDTIKGFLYDKIDAEMANMVLFKKEREGTTVSKFKTTDLLEFGFKNKRTFHRIQRIKDNKDTTFVFAKKIVEGKIDLWLLRGTKKPSEFYVANNSTNQKAHIFRPGNKDYLQIEGNNYSEGDVKYLGIQSFVGNEPVKDNYRNRRSKFSEKGIQKDIVSYNSKFRKDYPTKVYEEEQVFSYDVTVGISVLKFEQGDFIRAAFYRNKTKVEKSRKLSRIQGISYHGWFDENENGSREIQNGTSNYRWQVLSIIPIGYRIQGASKVFQPYAYAGLGVGILFKTDYKFVDSINTGSETSIVPFPTLNMGAGIRRKFGSKYLLAEITPSVNGIFMNLGVSF
ncbi:hypothetical protein JM83_0137 [Gillisia sp. Hel_I_86]|uniref:hypothetical protein n=1 Tax=Gillisia sp. Hel_I_86 TaxID=1249981 RepID=UPI00119B88F8|nr:hypothetical protein [Gillisia sp. Hel_I_86]TVZ25235.1 hypothetical protein JM83_0137 [Gillisia sp. Hel_I_86]